MGERITRLRVTRDHCGRPCVERLAPAEWGRKRRKAEVDVPGPVADRWLTAQAAWWRCEAEIAGYLDERPEARKGEG